MELNRRQMLKIMLIITLSIIIFTAAQNLGTVMVFLSGVISILTPFITGMCIAFIINIPMRRLENGALVFLEKSKYGHIWMRWRRAVCLLLSILIIFAVFTVFLLLIVPEIRLTIIEILEKLPGQLDRVASTLTSWIQSLGIEQYHIEMLNIDWNSIGGEVLKRFTQGGTTVLNTTISATGSVIGNIVNLVVGFVFAIYILLSKDHLSVQLRKIAYALLPEQKATKIFNITGMSANIFTKFVIGQCTEAVILGVLCFIGMSIFSLPYAVMISSLVAVTALVPVFGAFIGTGVGVLLIFFQSPVQAVGFLVFMLILQQLEGNIIYPKVVGDSVGLPGMWVLFAVTIGGSLFGAVGMLVSVPACALLYCLAREGINAILKEKKVKTSLYERQEDKRN